MFGMILAVFSTWLDEISSIIGKKGVAEHQESFYAMGFLNTWWSGVFFFIMVFIQWFAGSPATIVLWPTLILHIILSVFQGYATVKAITLTDRSVFGFLRVLTLPLLLGIDLLVGYPLSSTQITAVLFVIIVLIALSSQKIFGKKGLGWTLACAINSAFTLSLFKYNISNGNSLALEQLLVVGAQIIFFAILARRSHNVIFGLLKKPRFFLQSISIGLAGVVGSYAYLFAPASIIATTFRASATTWSVLSGHWFFHERKWRIKLIGLVALLAGIIWFGMGR